MEHRSPQTHHGQFQKERPSFLFYFLAKNRRLLPTMHLDRHSSILFFFMIFFSYTVLVPIGKMKRRSHEETHPGWYLASWDQCKWHKAEQSCHHSQYRCLYKPLPYHWPFPVGTNPSPPPSTPLSLICHNSSPSLFRPSSSLLLLQPALSYSCQTEVLVSRADKRHWAAIISSSLIRKLSLSVPYPDINKQTEAGRNDAELWI